MIAFPLAIVIVLSCCGFSNAALADWQYTKWGMTVDEVIAASGGKAIEFTDSRHDTDNERLMAIAPYVAGDFHFEARFNFDKKNNHLRGVTLHLKAGNPHFLYAALVNRYGQPISDEESSVTRVARWLDRENNNNVVWFMIGSDYTTVEYRALIGESEEAL